MRKKLLFLISILLISLFFIGCKEPSKAGIGDWYCEGDLLYDDTNSLVMDCSKEKGNMNPSQFCREKVYVKGVGTYGALCVECFTLADCPTGYDCGEYDDPQNPYMCIDKPCEDNSDCSYHMICDEGTCIRIDCTDTDGGSDEFVKGTATKTTIRWTSSAEDICISSTQLEEVYCLENGQSDSTLITCSNGCEDGACKEEPPPECGDGNCDSNENCGNCIDDCPCQSDEICQNNKCVVKRECTTPDDCSPPPCIGIEVKCVNNICTQSGNCVTCTEDKDCDDNDDKTIDSCINGSCSNIRKPKPFPYWIFSIPIGLILIGIILYFVISKRRKRK